MKKISFCHSIWNDIKHGMVNSMEKKFNTFAFAIRILLKISMKRNNDMEMLKRINLDESECKN